MKNKNGNKISIITALLLILFFGSYITGRAAFQERVVYINQNVYDEFQNAYDTNNEETTLCLRGEKVLDGWKITNVYQPKIIETAVNTMSYEACGSGKDYVDVIGTWHTHPQGICEMSDSDMFSFGGDYYQYGLDLSMVQCSKDKIGIFTKDVIFSEGYTFAQDSLRFKII